MRISTRRPRRKQLSIIGRRVALTRPLTTHGGERFSPGTSLLILGTWRGKLHLIDDRGREILHVHPGYVEAVVDRRATPPRDRLRLYLRRVPRGHRL